MEGFLEPTRLAKSALRKGPSDTIRQMCAYTIAEHALDDLQS